MIAVARLSLLALAALAGALAPGCGRDPALPDVGLEPLAELDLAAIEPVPREQIETQQARLRDLRRAAPHELAGGYGGLGELYHAYELLPAAAAAYRNAERLDPQSFLWPYYLGAVYQALGDLDAAAASLERALALRGDEPPARLRLAEVRLARGEHEAARALFETLLAEDGFAAAARYGLGRVAAAAGDAEAAVEHFEKTLELQPEAGSVRYPLAQTLRRLGREDRAREVLAGPGSGAVRAPDPLIERLDDLARSSGAHLKRGNRALLAGRLDEAVEAFRRAVEARPDYGEARRSLALALARRGEHEAAIRELETALEDDSGNVWLHLDLGNVYRAQERLDEAAGALRRAVELAPDFAAARFNLGSLLVALERWEEAREHLAATVALEPENARARHLLAVAKHRGGASEEAIAELRAVLDADPGDDASREALATVLAETGKQREALATYRGGLDPALPAAERAAALDRYARFAWQIGRRGEAIDGWREAAALVPDSSAAQVALANALQLAGERREAREVFARAVELDPKNAQAWLSEASLLILDGRFRRARERLEAALAHAPEHPGLNHTLARLLATSPRPATRDGARALALARKAYRLSATLEHAETVGMALAESGRFEEAAAWQQQLVNQAARSGDRALLQRLMINLRRYQERRPVRVAG